MKAKIKLVVIILIIVIASGLYSVVDKTGEIYNRKYDNNEYVPLELNVGEEISQRFVCDKERLDGFAIKLTEKSGVEGSELGLSYELWESEQEKCVLQGSQDISEVKSGKFFEINFDKLGNCKGKTYIFKLTVNGKNEQDGIVVYYAPEIEKETELKYDTKNVDGTLVLRTITHGFDVETFVVTICFLAYIVFFMKWLYKLFS